MSLSYRDSHAYFYLLGSSCLFTGDIGGASTYLRRAEQLNFRHADTLAGLAAVHVRRGETDKAVQLYLDILEREPENRFAPKALSFLRANSAPEKIEELVNTGGISYIYPKPNIVVRKIIRCSVAVLVISLFLAAAWFVIQAFPSVPEPKESRLGMESFLLTDIERSNPVTLEGEFDYVLTEKEALATFDKAKNLFSSWNDAAARVELNRLLLSNASPVIKNKAQTLLGFLKTPTFTNIQEAYDFTMVSRDPRLFEGVPVLWRGSAANVVSGDPGTSFDFLVGYQDRKKLDGIVLVRLPFSAAVQPGSPLEILGKIRPVGNTFEIEGIALHELREDGY